VLRRSGGSDYGHREMIQCTTSEARHFVRQIHIAAKGYPALHFPRAQHLAAEWEKECESVAGTRHHCGYHPGQLQARTHLLNGGEGVGGDSLVRGLAR